MDAATDKLLTPIVKPPSSTLGIDLPMELALLMPRARPALLGLGRPALFGLTRPALLGLLPCPCFLKRSGDGAIMGNIKGRSDETQQH